MDLRKKKMLAGKVLGCSPYRVRFDIERLDEIKEAITKKDIISLVKDYAVWKENVQGISRGRAKKRHLQRKKGLQKGFGSRKGSKNARNPQKLEWKRRIRLLRVYLKILRDKQYITTTNYHTLYMKAKGGFFRSLKHIKLYVNEHKLLQKPINMQ
ncbi:50S ribosomal protein L19e [Candidatus Woesearchaeota archaeon]|nr:50S ribosomal protein L19e [Candidatus Woesearchaeota archaeon]